MILEFLSRELIRAQKTLALKQELLRKYSDDTDTLRIDVETYSQLVEELEKLVEREANERKG